MCKNNLNGTIYEMKGDSMGAVNVLKIRAPT